jgi:hypothetical protein
VVGKKPTGWSSAGGGRGGRLKTSGWLKSL